jgi:hypothetical protein
VTPSPDLHFKPCRRLDPRFDCFVHQLNGKEHESLYTQAPEILSQFHSIPGVPPQVPTKSTAASLQNQNLLGKRCEPATFCLTVMCPVTLGKMVVTGKEGRKEGRKEGIY